MSVLSRVLSFLTFSACQIFCGKKTTVDWYFINTSETGWDDASRILNNLTLMETRWVGTFTKETLIVNYINLLKIFLDYKTSISLYLPDTSLWLIRPAFHLDLNLDVPMLFGFSSVFWRIVSAGFWQTPAAIAGTDIVTETPTWLNTTESSVFRVFSDICTADLKIKDCFVKYFLSEMFLKYFSNNSHLLWSVSSWEIIGRDTHW